MTLSTIHTIETATAPPPHRERGAFLARKKSQRNLKNPGSLLLFCVVRHQD
jgi:hypothetical protein